SSAPKNEWAPIPSMAAAASNIIAKIRPSAKTARRAWLSTHFDTRDPSLRLTAKITAKPPNTISTIAHSGMGLFDDEDEKAAATAAKPSQPYRSLTTAEDRMIWPTSVRSSPRSVMIAAITGRAEIESAMAMINGRARGLLPAGGGP